MSNIWPILSWVFLQLIDDIVGMIITVQEYVLMFLVLGYFQWSLLQHYDDLLLIFYVLFYEVHLFHNYL